MAMFIRMGEMIIILLAVLSVAAAVACPSGQFWHAETSACCVPAFDCGIDSEVRICRTNGSFDQCVPCGKGRTNGYVTWSGTHSQHRCFNLTHKHEKCAGDTVPVPTIFQEKCSLPCRCHHEECFYGDPCYCSTAEPCGINEELNTTTGACQPCPAGWYKLTSGCGPCLINTTAFGLIETFKHYKVINETNDNVTYEVIVEEEEDSSQPEPGITARPSGKVGKSTDSNKQAGEEGELSMVAVIIGIVVLVAIGILVAVVLVVLRRKLKSGDTNSKLVVCYYKLTGTPVATPQDEEAGITAESAIVSTSVPVQEVSPMVQPIGEEPRMEVMKSATSDGPEPMGVEPEPGEDLNTTTTPLIGGTQREDDETEKKTKE